MFYQTYIARRPPQSPPAATEWSVCFCMTLFAVSAFHSVAVGGDGSAQRVFVPGDLDLLTLTFKLVRAKDQTRLFCEFGANLFSGFRKPRSHRQR